MRWRLVVPIAIERDVPSQATEELYIIGNVRIKKDTPGLRQRWQYCASNVQVGLVELEELQLSGHYCGCDVWTGLRMCGFRIYCVLPSEAGEQRNLGMIGVLKITSDASAQVRLKSDILCRTLKQVAEARVVPVVPAQ